MMGAKRDACPHAEWMKIHINLHDARVLKLMSMGVDASQLVCPDALRAAGAGPKSDLRLRPIVAS
jgi:hypothetical protein